MRGGIAHLLVAVVATGLATGAAAGPRRPSAPIVNGTATTGWPSTGLIETPSGLCTGVLIGCQTFLTAAHCFCDTSRTGAECQADPVSVDPAHTIVFLQHAGFVTVANVTVHPAYVFDDAVPTSTADLAVVELASPLDGIAPSPINTVAPPPAGTPATLVGFGSTGVSGGEDVGFGLKREGSVTLGACDPGLVCWSFDGSQANTCHGDSGGPLFVSGVGGQLVGGITSGGSSGACEPGDFSFDADVSTYAAWIQGTAGADVSSTTCGTLAQAGAPGTTIFGRTGSWDTTGDALFAFGVSPATSALRVTLNGTLTGDVDLFVRAGGPATTSTFDCASRNGSAFESCEFLSPRSGIWWVLLRTEWGAGDYQLTATTFGGDPPTCGNTVPESGEECDGSAIGACEANCSEDCTCAPCPTGDLDFSTVQLAPRFVLKGSLANAHRRYDSIDPRGGLSLRIEDLAGNTLAAEIPTNDPGWRVYARGHGYRWKGNAAGIRRVRFRQKSTAWRILLKGRNLAGAAALDYAGLRLALTYGGTCTAKVFQ